MKIKRKENKVEMYIFLPKEKKGDTISSYSP